MKLYYQSPYKSISGNPAPGYEIPPFTLITGLNGAGKTHLLEAIQKGAISRSEGGYPEPAPRLVTSQELQVVDHISATPETREQKIERLREAVRRHGSALGWDEQYAANFRGNLASEGLITADAITSAERRAGKLLMHWTDVDYANFTPIDVGIRDIFTTLVADTFFNYVYLHTLNGYRRWRSEALGEQHSWLPDETFVAEFGTPPWDLLNQVLADSGLPYEYDAPSPTLTMPFPALRLIDQEAKRDVDPSELSSGERTLLAIALTAYSSDSAARSIRLPPLILLDEPDATLHPTMVRVLLNLLQTRIVGKLGIPVIMTTHSPTTVALVDENAIHVMSRNGSPRLLKVSRDHGLRNLLVGVPHLSVSAENRRTVIVESPNDERTYTKIRTVLGARVVSDRSLQFMAAGGGGLPDGCDAVTSLVRRLRMNGNDQVWGFVDRDWRSDEPSSMVLMDRSRHSIENLIFDPLPLALLLVRDGVSDLLNDVSTVYTNVQDTDAQQLVDRLTSNVFPSVGPERKIHDYVDGLKLTVPVCWSETRGHDLERLVRERYPQLNRLPNVADAMVGQIWAEMPWAIPKSIVDAMARLSI